MEDILRGRQACAVAADLRRRSGTTQLNHLVGMLCVHDVELDFGYLFAQRRAQPIDWRAPGDRADARAPRKIPLGDGWPMLRLSDEALERLRGAPGRPQRLGERGPRAGAGARAARCRRPGRRTGPPRPRPCPRRGAPPATDRRTEPPSASHARAGARCRSAAGCPCPPSCPRPARSRLRGRDGCALDGYLETMERFLMHQRGGHGRIPRGGAAVAVEQPQRPLVGTIVGWEPEVELVAQRVVDPLEDRYLLDHTLGRTVSRTDPELHALALMPLAMSIEILAEAASCLLPDRSVTGMRDVRAHRWLAFGEAPQTLEVSVRRLAAEGAASACGSSCATSTMAAWRRTRWSRRPCCSGMTSRRRRRRPRSRWTAPGRRAGARAALRRGDVPPAAVAGRQQRRRRRARRRAGAARGAAAGRSARVTPASRASCWTRWSLDAAGQVIGFWAAEMLEQARVVFPFRLAALDLYGPPPRRGRAARLHGGDQARGRAARSAPTSTCSTRPAAAGCGLRGWEDKRFAVPERFAPLAARLS